MAYSFESKFDVKSLDELERRLARVSAEAAPAVAASNRDHAFRLATVIRGEMPVGGTSFVRNQHPASRANEYEGRQRRPGGRPGLMRDSVTSGGSAQTAWVKGGGPRVPYFLVNEFGGWGYWRRTASTNPRAIEGHAIPVRRRAPTMAELGLYDSSGTQRGSAGWFFFPSLRKYMPHIQQQLIEDAERIVREQLTMPVAA